MRVKLTLILAPDRENASLPAGAGELSLIESWAAGQVFPVKLLSLTSADSHPEAFVNRLQSALDGIIHLEVSLEVSIEDRVTDLVNAILDVPSDFALIIFGYSLVEAQSVHPLICRILEYQPPQMHLYVITPAVPPWPNLPRMRVRRQVLQVTWPKGSPGARSL